MDFGIPLLIRARVYPRKIISALWALISLKAIQVVITLRANLRTPRNDQSNQLSLEKPEDCRQGT